MSGRLVFIVVAAIANVGLGAFIWLKSSRNAINRYFALFSFAVAIYGALSLLDAGSPYTPKQRQHRSQP